VTQPIVQLQGVTKRIGSKTIIENLSFDVPKGEVFGFLGPNGAGKTTTIRMMVGLMKMTDGEILINGHSIRKQFEHAIRHVGAIVENPEMYKYLSGYHNLVHYARMMTGITSHRIDEVVQLVGLEKRIHDKVKTYSLGMRQRLGVAQALLHKPSLLILDEPTNGLDPAGIRELRDYLRKLSREQGVAVIVSSHLLSEMELMCDRVAIIQNGKLVDVRLLHKEAEPGIASKPTVLFEVSEADRSRAVEVAVTLVGPDVTPQVDVAGVSLSATRDDVAKINRALVEAGIPVYGIRIITKSLEDTFLEMTGGESIA
jgi:ABC-2 type transport system ATP-binding protein